MSTADVSAAATAPAASASPRATHFEFLHPVFGVKGGYFAFMRPSDEIGFYFPFGEMYAVTPMERLQFEFELDPAGVDVRLMQTVAQGLRHVREIRPGDSIPKEILDGTASWSVEDKHHEIARDRLDLQVWSWLQGRERVIVLHQSQEQVAGDPYTLKAIAKGHQALAAALGHGEGGAEEVKFQLERIRREIVYVEGLRDRYAFIRDIASGLRRYNRIFGKNKTTEGEIGRARALMRTPVQLFDSMFAQVDARTGEIVALLKNPDVAIERIRENRDDLHFAFMIWDALIEKWQDAVYERGGEGLALIKETYRFLAINYTAEVSWMSLAARR